MTSIAVIGGGKIGEALIAGLVASGLNPESIAVSNRRPERGAELRERYGVQDVSSNAAAAELADVIFLSVKPDLIPTVLDEIAEPLEESDGSPVVVSLAAGVTLDTLEDSLGAGAHVMRVMPNTPMLVRRGMCVVSPSRFCTPDEVELVVELLGAVGEVEVLPESKMDAVTALSGSSPAYFFLVAEALVDAGVALGFPRQTAQRLACASLDGAAALLREPDADPVRLRADVSSPAGTTVAAIRSLEESGLRAAFYRATQACAERSAELGRANPSRSLPGREESHEEAQ